MRRWLRVLVASVLVITGMSACNRGPATPPDARGPASQAEKPGAAVQPPPAAAQAPPQAIGGFDEIECRIDGDDQADVVRVYNLQRPNADGAYADVVIFALRQSGGIVPVYLYEGSGQFSGTLRVWASDLDADGLSEFIVEEWDAGISHGYMGLKVLKLTLNGDAAVVADELYSDYFQDATGPVTIEPLATKGHVRIALGDEISFVLVNGRRPKEQ